MHRQTGAVLKHSIGTKRAGAIRLKSHRMTRREKPLYSDIGTAAPDGQKKKTEANLARMRDLTLSSVTATSHWMHALRAQKK